MPPATVTPKEVWLKFTEAMDVLTRGVFTSVGHSGHTAERNDASNFRFFGHSVNPYAPLVFYRTYEPAGGLSVPKVNK